MSRVSASTGDPVSQAPERDRKAEHIQLALDRRMQVGANYFEDYYFEHRALPEIDLADVDTSTTFLDRQLAAPLLISCMTGGTEEAAAINRTLAIAAEQVRIALGVGSQRKAIEDSAAIDSFRVRSLAPSVPLLANLGAVQLNYGFGLKEFRAAVEMIEADALVLHLNPLQEAIQPEGQCDFSNLIAKIGELVRRLEVPVIVKEIGSGISARVARALLAEGIEIIDCAGVGGTSWARIEAQRARDLEIGEVFADWGLPTPVCLQELRRISGLTLIGSGGVRNGIDVAKAIAMGAHLAGLAQPFLEAARESPNRVVDKANRIVRELKIAMFCLGVRTLEELRGVELRRRSVG